MVSQDNESRGRILAAAVVEFSARGFDGARMDAIARRAEVNKALIYYYFANKAALLDVLLNEFFTGLRQVQTAVAPARPDEPPSAFWDRHIEAVVGYLKLHLDVIRLVLLEELKGGAEHRLLTAWKAAWEGSGAPSHTDAPLFGLFFGDLPLALFFLLNPAWSAAMNRDPAASEERFLALHRSLSDAFYNGRL